MREDKRPHSHEYNCRLLYLRLEVLIHRAVRVPRAGVVAISQIKGFCLHVRMIHMNLFMYDKKLSQAPHKEDGKKLRCGGLSPV